MKKTKRRKRKVGVGKRKPIDFYGANLENASTSRLEVQMLIVLSLR